jgi:hypothetical protein
MGMVILTPWGLALLARPPNRPVPIHYSMPLQKYHEGKRTDLLHFCIDRHRRSGSPQTMESNLHL